MKSCPVNMRKHLAITASSFRKLCECKNQKPQFAFICSRCDKRNDVLLGRSFTPPDGVELISLQELKKPATQSARRRVQSVNIEAPCDQPETRNPKPETKQGADMPARKDKQKGRPGDQANKEACYYCGQQKSLKKLSGQMGCPSCSVIISAVRLRPESVTRIWEHVHGEPAPASLGNPQPTSVQQSAIGGQEPKAQSAELETHQPETRNKPEPASSSISIVMHLNCMTSDEARHAAEKIQEALQ